MEKFITIDNRKIFYLLRESKRARRLRLTVYFDGSVVVTTPYNLKEKFVESFIREKAKWLFSKIVYFEHFKRGPTDSHTHEDYLKYKAAARLLIEKRVEHFNKRYGFQYNRIFIRNQKTRWGSCSRKGNLNFNYKLFFLPEQVRDYVVVHELCHLKELNHSGKFWDLVASVFPDYACIKKELRKSSMGVGK